ncbi:Na+/H+ antiporter NhaC family protein [Clostridium vitabionis]|uniref:Na+/H+ antiporter NhaC family protein n=1 Tax=Clostridium vitabionis TaxID=2784388 RepID=UPI00188AD6AB|nr:Na+/H+ antiporter NhaC family protein [Clostridium vitabionis]
MEDTKCTRNKKMSFATAGITLLVFAAVAALLIIGLQVQPHVALMAGCVIVSIVGLADGTSWDSIEKGMIDGMSQALGACAILVLIGCLIGVWVISGVVPAMIYYGLKLLTPTNFLVGSMLLSGIVSMVLGSWGAAGTVGLALVSIAKIMGFPVGIAAGAIISGCYIGDRISPISDMCNLVASVTNISVTKNSKNAILINSICIGATALILAIISLNYRNNCDITIQIASLSELIGNVFRINLLDFIPAILLFGCIIMKLSAIPSITIGILAGIFQAAFIQGKTLQEIFNSCYYGNVLNSGNTFLDSLLTVGGIGAIQSTLVLALVGMMLGGAMEATGLMDAFMNPLIQRLHRKGDIILTIIISTLLTTMIMADSYVAVVLPESMFKEPCKKHGISQQELALAIGSGAGSFSPLIPWSTCGIFLSTVLGVAGAEYIKFTFLNILVPLGMILLGYLPPKRNSSIHDNFIVH